MSVAGDNAEKWEGYYKNHLKDSYLFPNEYVVRSFLGTYPNLQMDKDYKGKKICDVSCGDGRNMVVLNKLGFDLYGTEITDEICKITKEKLLNSADRIEASIQKGVNWELPFDDEFLDYILSWNGIYYMKDENSSIEGHIKEHARTLKKDGYLVCSVPGPKCFSLENAEELGNNLIKLSPSFNWGGLNIHKDTIYYRFDSFDHIKDVFGEYFHNFSTCLISDDCYGLQLDYFVFVCQKK